MIDSRRVPGAVTRSVKGRSVSMASKVALEDAIKKSRSCPLTSSTGP